MATPKTPQSSGREAGKGGGSGIRTCKDVIQAQHGAKQSGLANVGTAPFGGREEDSLSHIFPRKNIKKIKHEKIKPFSTRSLKKSSIDKTSGSLSLNGWAKFLFYFDWVFRGPALLSVHVYGELEPLKAPGFQQACWWWRWRWRGSCDQKKNLIRRRTRHF